MHRAAVFEEMVAQTHERAADLYEVLAGPAARERGCAGWRSASAGIASGRWRPARSAV